MEQRSVAVKVLFQKDIIFHLKNCVGNPLLSVFRYTVCLGRLTVFGGHFLTQFFVSLTQTVQVYANVTKIEAEKVWWQVLCCVTLQVSSNER